MAGTHTGSAQCKPAAVMITEVATAVVINYDTHSSSWVEASVTYMLGPWSPLF